MLFAEYFFSYFHRLLTQFYGLGIIAEARLFNDVA